MMALETNRFFPQFPSSPALPEFNGFFNSNQAISTLQWPLLIQSTEFLMQT